MAFLWFLSARYSQFRATYTATVWPGAWQATSVYRGFTSEHKH